MFAGATSSPLGSHQRNKNHPIGDTGRQLGLYYHVDLNIWDD